MRPVRRHLVALICLALAGCGSSDDEPKGKPLPRAAVSELQTRLDEVERRYRDAVENDNAGACSDISNDSFAGGPDRGIDQILSDLPDDVDPDLRTAVSRSFENLRALAEEGCAEVRPPSETEPEAEPEADPVPVPEAPIPEVAPPKEKAPKKTLPEEPAPEVEDGGGAVPPGEGGTPPGQNGTPGNSNGGGAQAPPGLELD